MTVSFEPNTLFQLIEEKAHQLLEKRLISKRVVLHSQCLQSCVKDICHALNIDEQRLDILVVLHSQNKTTYQFLKELLFKIIAKRIIEKKEAGFSYRIKEIGYLAGYRYPSDFSSAFKRYYNVSPTQYRNQHQ